MKKTIVLVIAIVLCAFLCVSCDTLFFRLRGTYYPVGGNASSAPFKEVKFGKSSIDAYTTADGYIHGTYTLKSGHLNVLWDKLGSDRYSIEKGPYHGDFWLDGKYSYTQGSYGYF